MRIIAGRERIAVQEKKPARRFASDLYDTFAWLAVAMSVFVAAALLAVRLMIVDGHSMEPTLHHGDVMVTSNLGFTPARGDIVVLNNERFYYGQPIVKRVIALAGDEIDIDFDAGEVYLNGELLLEDYIAEPTHKQEGLAFPQTVPEGCVFVMGDNRNHSDDSRHPELGMVDTRYIIGKVRAVLPVGTLAEKLKKD